MTTMLAGWGGGDAMALIHVGDAVLVVIFVVITLIALAAMGKRR